MLPFLARLFLLNRLFGSQTRSRRRGSYGYGRRRRRSSGFGMTGPFPTYSRRTRGGGRVSVGGCCLPIPLALVAGVVGAARILTHRH